MLGESPDETEMEYISDDARDDKVKDVDCAQSSAESSDKPRPLTPPTPFCGLTGRLATALWENRCAHAPPRPMGEPGSEAEATVRRFQLSTEKRRMMKTKNKTTKKKSTGTASASNKKPDRNAAWRCGKVT